MTAKVALVKELIGQYDRLAAGHRNSRNAASLEKVERKAEIMRAVLADLESKQTRGPQAA